MILRAVLNLYGCHHDSQLAQEVSCLSTVLVLRNQVLHGLSGHWLTVLQSALDTVLLVHESIDPVLKVVRHDIVVELKEVMVSSETLEDWISSAIRRITIIVDVSAVYVVLNILPAALFSAVQLFQQSLR